MSGLMNGMINLSLYIYTFFFSLFSPLKRHLNTAKLFIPKIHILPSWMCVCMEVGVWGGVESQLVRGKRTGLRSSPTMRSVPHFGFLNLAYGTFSFSQARSSSTMSCVSCLNCFYIVFYWSHYYKASIVFNIV